MWIDECRLCPIGTYGFNVSQTNCIPCSYGIIAQVLNSQFCFNEVIAANTVADPVFSRGRTNSREGTPTYYYRPQRSSGKVIFSQASVILFTGGCLVPGAGVCLVLGGGVVSEHALEVSRSTPKGEAYGDGGGVSRPTPKGEVEGDLVQAHTHGVS